MSKYKPGRKVIYLILVAIAISSASIAMLGCRQLSTTGSTTNLETTTTATTRSSETTTAKPARPAKTVVTLKLEGNEVIVPVTLYESSLGYSMYYDDILYKVSQTVNRLDETSKDLADQYIPIKPVEGLPDIYLEIGHLPNLDPETAMTMMMTLLAQKYSSVAQASPVGIGVDKIDALVIEASDGDKADSKLASIAIINAGQNGAYYFLNAYYIKVAEGHKSRLNQLIDTFRIE